MDVRLYGRLGDLLGKQVQLDPPPGGCSIAELRVELARYFPQAEAQFMSPGVRAIVGDTVVNEDRHVSVADTVEFFPPVSGG
ncbi:MoaD/ThiS family protein [Sphingomonas sp. KRR8]|uniref:MoaD/ThiS family protein n=1 Tax=Sphingomonas sp. KRR8 TaxID=2942996 RepID=UPI002021AD1D|nr:MoaD/ThiS family protein [Sphingomonas sp. KRR8]URD59805.1 MoaD/ThiS family protein [Sphingomonas sp. KRR8]